MTGKLQDIEVLLADRPGTLAEFGETLGDAGVSLEGGVVTVGSAAVAHFLVDDAATAKDALEAMGLGPVMIHDVVMLKLAQGIPGQLGLLSRRMADAGINIEVQYSDHDHNLVLIVPDHQHAQAKVIAAAWTGSPGSEVTDRVRRRM